MDIVKFLLESGAKVNVQKNFGFTALHWAAVHDHLEVGKLLLEVSDVDAVDFNNSTAVHWAASGGHLKLVQLFFRHGGSKLTSKDDSGLSPLEWAVKKGHAEIAQVNMITQSLDSFKYRSFNSRLGGPF